MQGQLEREALLDIPAAAAYLNVDEYTIRRLINRGLIAAVQLGGVRGGLIRIRPGSLDRVLRGWETRTR
jgi:excisionase family DNA binding protein